MPRFRVARPCGWTTRHARRFPLWRIATITPTWRSSGGGITGVSAACDVRRSAGVRVGLLEVGGSGRQHGGEHGAVDAGNRQRFRRARRSLRLSARSPHLADEPRSDARLHPYDSRRSILECGAGQLRFGLLHHARPSGAEARAEYRARRDGRRPRSTWLGDCAQPRHRASRTPAESRRAETGRSIRIARVSDSCDQPESRRAHLRTITGRSIDAALARRQRRTRRGRLEAERVVIATGTRPESSSR